MIKPTIGRIVWFTPSWNADDRHDKSQSLAAIVTYVWSDNMVNLAVFSPEGTSRSVTSVRLLQDEETAPEHGYYAEWMPYQKGAAARYEKENRQAT